MTIIRAFRSGISRVTHAPLVLAGVCVLSFLVALPLGLTLQQMLAEKIGASAAGANMSRGFDYAWWQLFNEQASGVARAFSPAVVGGAAVVDNAGSMLDNRSHIVPLVCAGAAYLLAWTFLLGGILDRYARDRRTRGAGFFAACGTHFFRLLRLGLLAGLVYAVLFTWLHGWLFGSVYRSLIDGTTVESRAFVFRVTGYLLFGAVLCLCNLVLDYAKVRIVVEDRRSAVLALVAAARFIRRHPPAFGLYLLDGCCVALLVTCYALFAPGAGAAMWWTFVVGQAYLLARLWVKLLFYASELAFFQQALAHAEYIVAPVPVWPDSPAAEAIGETQA